MFNDWLPLRNLNLYAKFNIVYTADSSYDEAYTAKTVYEGMQIEVEESMQTGLRSFSCTLSIIFAGTGIALIKMEKTCAGSQ